MLSIIIMKTISVTWNNNIIIIINIYIALFFEVAQSAALHVHMKYNI